MTNNNKSMAESNFIGVAEAARVLGISIAYLYKLTSARAIPYYKPRGGILRFDKDELQEYVRGTKVATREELDAMVERR